MKKTFSFAAIKINFIGFFVLFFCISCSKNTELKSKNILDRNLRIEKIKPEIKIDSEILDTEFDLFNVNGFNDDFILIPGQSSIDYKFVVKVDPKNIPKWTKTLEKTNGDIQSQKWIDSLIEKRKNNWITTSDPVFYKRKNDQTTTIIIFEKEGIIYKRISKL